jgi:hypothetical protein
MRNLLILIRNGAFAVAIAVALSFGAAEVLSGTPHATLQRDDCTFPDYCEDEFDCDEICQPSPPYYGGFCYHRLSCCICYE